MASLTLVGAPFSTFTRTFRMALHCLEVPYTLETTTPYTDLAYKYHPFGRIPSLLHNEQTLFESATIRAYIDHEFNNSLTPTDFSKRLQMETIISCLCDYVFHHVVFGIAKPRHFYEQQGLKETEITARFAKGPLEKAGKIMEALESIIVKDSEFLCGEQLTWADYYVFPVLADLFCLPECDFFKEKAPGLFTWYEGFKKREEAVITYKDTVADMRNNDNNNNNDSNAKF
ncbi:uncharacterized protein BX663DRAFT_497229 [Cokeromyces recurvatus]|uniref:uncharacterized protein n=1 Tax=Cokeromyces recurvatus TaxID=90255 RepID=UPI00221F3C61|nr:uncharacterized protein BX663DRAFT_497229 [Cokeromyces recurvatus]KAI7906659.1 hypothetical protein BX663DRAFT_497229 [Cokeromyces recurvatus]